MSEDKHVTDEGEEIVFPNGKPEANHWSKNMTIPDHCPDCGSRNFQVRYDYQAAVRHIWVCGNCYYTIDLEKYNGGITKESVPDNNE